jgi:hydrogenase/urease accessory protein HupE
MRPAWLLFALVAVWAMPSTAHAHLVNTGFGPFYDGITYLFVSPANVMTVLALAMFAGLRGRYPARNAIFLLTAAWLLGAFVSLHFSSGDVHLPLAVAVVMLCIGLLVALDLRMPTVLVAASVVCVGLFFGALNGSAMTESVGSVRALLGAAAAVFTIASIGAAVVVSQGVGWRRVIVRVAGSWIVAIGFLMAGWVLKPG